jgi:hypothetical protein
MTIAKTFGCALAVAAVSFAGGLFAQDAQPGVQPMPEPELKRPAAGNEADRPVRPLRVIVPQDPTNPSQNPPTEPGIPPTEPDVNAPPAEPPAPEPPVEENPPTFFGEPVTGDFGFTMDYSGSMNAGLGSGPMEDGNGNIIANPNRMQALKIEATNVVQALEESQKFALVWFASGVQYYQSLVEATEANKQTAIQQIAGMNASGMTAAHDALHRACIQYGNDYDRLYFLCDGGPNVTGNASQILANFPGWFSGLAANGCQLIVIHLGTHGASFSQSLASQNGGTYIQR